MKAKSIKRKSAQEIKNAVEKLTGGGFRSTVAVVFISAGNELDDLLRRFRDHAILVFGAGFFCYGEIGRMPDGQYLFQHMTCAPALLKEITA